MSVGLLNVCIQFQSSARFVLSIIFFVFKYLFRFYFLTLTVSLKYFSSAPFQTRCLRSCQKNKINKFYKCAFLWARAHAVTNKWLCSIWNEEWSISEQVFIHSVTFIDVCLLDEHILLCNCIAWILDIICN